MAIKHRVKVKWKATGICWRHWILAKELMSMLVKFLWSTVSSANRKKSLSHNHNDDYDDSFVDDKSTKRFGRHNKNNDEF